MANSITVQGLTEVIVSLDKATSRLDPEVMLVLAKAGLNIKTGAVRRVSGHAHLPAYPHAISYDVTHGFGGPSVDVGPDKGRGQGALGNLVEFGSVNNAPIPHLAPELDIEAAKTEVALDALLGKLFDD
jgi:hypothetical protein